MKVTPKQYDEIFKSLSKMKILNRLMEFEYQMNMPDLYRSGIVKNHIKRIRESIEQIQYSLNASLKTKDDAMLDEFCGEMLDIITVVSQIGIQSIREFNQELQEALKPEIENQNK